MTDEQTDAEPGTVDPLAARLDRPLTEMTVDELMALKDEFENCEVRFYNNWRFLSLTPENLALATAAAIYAKTFLETLAKRHADALEDLVETRIRRKGKSDEYRIGVDDGSAATIAITEDTPDDARLALLGLDVTADELRGKVLRWNSSASAWLPADDQSGRSTADG
jgi:hypothetical protein